ncbi:hypothetical protein MJO28_000421 [Puccinia striiformis f. sp. tritici]|uniref:Uncharacterized protein n=1 Tax=Puccinia striiformis f. sp. tritici TaxID=168172 RepID=A0ACC0EY30_9BASI|nr:hypothetical protein MJO28_000421 [Puccinia striiformis f. sp. tritici]
MFAGLNPAMAKLGEPLGVSAVVTGPGYDGKFVVGILAETNLIIRGTGCPAVTDVLRIQDFTFGGMLMLIGG